MLTIILMDQSLLLNCQFFVQEHLLAVCLKKRKCPSGYFDVLKTEILVILSQARCQIMQVELKKTVIQLFIFVIVF